MFLKCHKRFKDGKEHRYWSIVEKRRCASGRIVDRHVLYLGEINDSQKENWIRCISVFDQQSQSQRALSLFPADRPLPAAAQEHGVQVRLSEFSLRHPRQWGACWLFLQLWGQLKLDEFWKDRLLASREGTQWYHVLVVLCAYRLIDPGSEWRLHRQWFENSALADLLGEDFALAAKDKLYRCLDKLLPHKTALFSFLQERWKDLFGASFEVLLYDLTSTYFESEPPLPPEDKRQFGYSRDRRSDCVQVVIALVVSVEGFPMAYEVMAGNTSDKSTLKSFLEKIQQQYGTARRIWVMDRGIPTEEALQEMRAQKEPPALYVVGTPKGRLTQLEAALLERSWQQARPGVQVKLLPQEGEVYVLVASKDRINKERAIRRRKLRQLVQRLQALQKQRPSYQRLLMAIGAAKQQAGRVWSLVEVQLPKGLKKRQQRTRTDFSFKLNWEKLRQAWRREGKYLVRTNLTEENPARLWQFYLQLVEVEEAFKNLKGDLAVRPIFHQIERRIEAHIFVCFLAYCVHVSLRAHCRGKAPGLTPRQVLDKFKAMQMVDVHFPTTDERELVFRRYTQPEADQKMLLQQLGLTLPEQPPPQISAKKELQM